MCWVNTNATKLCHRLASAETCRADPANGTTPKHAGTGTRCTHSSRHSLGKPSVLVSCRSPDLPSCFRLGWRCAGPGRPVAPCPNFRLPDRLRPLQDIHNVSSHVSRANRFPPSSGQTGRVFFLRSLPEQLARIFGTCPRRHTAEGTVRRHCCVWSAWPRGRQQWPR